MQQTGLQLQEQQLQQKPNIFSLEGKTNENPVGSKN